MIPLLAFLRWQRPDGRRISLWLPLFLLWPVVLPLLLVLLPFIILFLALAGGQPFRTLGAFWAFLAALRGTRIDVDTRSRAFQIQIF